jgi:cell division septum initiation protein DivIVA
MNDYGNIDAQESMEVTELLEMLYNSVMEARGMPLSSGKCVLEREATLGLLEDIRAQLPVELAESKRLLSAKDEFIINARREAESIRKAAEDEARRLVEEQEITQLAKTRANEIINVTEGRAREILRVANEYVDDALRRTEEAISAAQAEVKNSRARFRGLAGANMAPPQPPQAPGTGHIQTIQNDEEDV